jgi:hypothetical protein
MLDQTPEESTEPLRREESQSRRRKSQAKRESTEEERKQNQAPPHPYTQTYKRSVYYIYPNFILSLKRF